MGKTWRRTMVVLLATVDAAGKTLMTDMQGNATVNVVVPKKAVEIWKAKVAVTSDSIALGSGLGVVMFEGEGLAISGRHEIVCGGSGAEDVDAKHASVSPVLIGPMGIAVVENQDLEVSGFMVGEDVGNLVISIELIFSDSNHGPRLKWEFREGQTTALNTNVNGADLAQVTRGIKIPGNSKMIQSMIVCHASDFATLGAGGHAMALTSGLGADGINQEILQGGSGGELIVGAGDTTEVTWEGDCEIPVDSVNIMDVVFRQTGELSGTISHGISFGFVL